MTRCAWCERLPGPVWWQVVWCWRATGLVGVESNVACSSTCALRLLERAPLEFVTEPFKIWAHTHYAVLNDTDYVLGLRSKIGLLSVR